jgi:hypothetical protein
MGNWSWDSSSLRRWLRPYSPWTILGGLLAIVLSALIVYWFFSTPTVGESAIVLSVGAVFMTLLWDKVHKGIKALFVGIFLALPAIEYQAIKKDHAENAGAQADAYRVQQETLKQIGDGFTSVLKTDQDNFNKTISELLNSERAERRRFETLLIRQSELYAHEAQLAESLHGSLTPGSDTTPPNNCHPASNKEVLVMWGAPNQPLNVDLVSRFPTTRVTSESRRRT